jgi:hypothetical protein
MPLAPLISNTNGNHLPPIPSHNTLNPIIKRDRPMGNVKGALQHVIINLCNLPQRLWSFFHLDTRLLELIYMLLDFINQVLLCDIFDRAVARNPDVFFTRLAMD